MSWHCVGPGRGPAITALPTHHARDERGSAARSVALSAAVGAPVPPRARTTCELHVHELVGQHHRLAHDLGTTNAPRALGRSISARSAGAGPCAAARPGPSKMRGELTIAARFGFGERHRITSMRKSAEFGSSLGGPATQPGSSASGRTGAEPET
jgi:hypothetical protein